LHAYQSHVFLDWRELQSTAQHPWDRLCDHLHGRGVRSLDDALVNLELRPVHDALTKLLEPAMVRQFADLAEHPRAWLLDKNEAGESERTEFFDQAWARCESLLRAAQSAYLARLPKESLPPADNLPTDPGLLMHAFRQRLRAAMRIPSMEALFPQPWTPAARRILPSPSPQLTATAIWGPILGWCALELLAESINANEPEPVALDLFDRLRLRGPFAQSFAALGFEGEESWQVAARIKVVLLTGAGVGKEEPTTDEDVEPTAPAKSTAKSEPKDSAQSAPPPAKAPAPATEAERIALAPVLWHDPDVRWLTGLHETEGHFYVVREQYEELLWWLLMPSLLSLAAQPTPSAESIAELGKTVSEALATVEESGYRMDELLGSAPEVEIVSDEDVVDEEAPDDEDLDAVDMDAIIEQGTEIDDDLEFQDDEDDDTSQK
jgi:hypothetical protein